MLGAAFDHALLQQVRELLSAWIADGDVVRDLLRRNRKERQRSRQIGLQLLVALIAGHVPTLTIARTLSRGRVR